MIRKAITVFGLLLGIASLSESAGLIGKIELESDTGHLHSAGQSFQLYGIQVIDGNRQCIANGLNWNCGKTAQQTLLSYLADESLVCFLLSNAYSQNAEFPEVECFLGTQSLNAKLVAEGWALTAIDILVPYRNESLVAQQNGDGVFRDGFVPPDEWRPLPRTGLEECGVCTIRHQSLMQAREKRKARLESESENN